MAFLQREVLLFPPVDILLVTESTDHHGARAECRIDCLILHDRDIVAEEGTFMDLPFSLW